MRRLAGFLDAVAERIGSSIGALYNYFPDKQSIAFTLVNQYSQEVEAHWKPLMEQAEILTHAEFADLFIERITQFAQERPAYLSLLAAPIRFRRDPAGSFEPFDAYHCNRYPLELEGPRGIQAG